MKKRLAHTVWECKYYIVWVPKNRRKVVSGKLKRHIGRILRKLCEYKGIEVLEGTACVDHMHIFLSIPPNSKMLNLVRLEPTDIVAILSLTYKGSFSIVLVRKSNFLSPHQKQ